jgi:hypothetical protein
MGCDKIDYRRIISVIVAFLVFLIVVLIISFLSDVAGEKSATSPIKIIGWLCGSLIAFEIFERLNDEEK